VKALGWIRIAITDHGACFGVHLVFNECKKKDQSPNLGEWKRTGAGDRRDPLDGAWRVGVSPAAAVGEPWKGYQISKKL